MQLLAFLFVSLAVFAAAHLLIGRWLARVFALRDDLDTPAHRLRDGLDYEPAAMSYLLPQHFSAIAAAGPIVGPILAGLYFGWGPAWLWIVLGSILIGGIHDFTALLASVRHDARSIAEVVRQYMNPRAYLLFLLFIWSALIYVVIAFTDVTAGTFVARGSAEDAIAPGPAVATSSLLYLGLAVLMGLTLRHTKIGPVRAKLIYLPLVALAITCGPWLPLDIAAWLGGGDPAAAGASAQRLWGYILLGYCLLAAMAPVWSLLQPRGELGGYFLYIVMIAGVVGIACGAFAGRLEIHHDFFKGWTHTLPSGDVAPLFPILFITVACGACSGFHSIVASGTTSKQVRRECDVLPIAYGGMLLEGLFACLSLATLMVAVAPAAKPDLIYAQGMRDFAAYALSPLMNVSDELRGALYLFALLCFATFVFDTLDACTRLARYILMELLGWKSRRQAWAATVLTLVVPVSAISLPPVVVNGKPLPLWQVFWGIFGSSNQLLAALTLLGVTVWLARKGLPYWLTLAPTLFMMLMTLWSLFLSIPPYLRLWSGTEPIALVRHAQFGITLTLIALSLWLIGEALITWNTLRPGSSRLKPALSRP